MRVLSARYPALGARCSVRSTLHGSKVRLQEGKVVLPTSMAGPEPSADTAAAPCCCSNKYGVRSAPVRRLKYGRTYYTVLEYAASLFPCLCPVLSYQLEAPDMILDGSQLAQKQSCCQDHTSYRVCVSGPLFLSSRPGLVRPSVRLSVSHGPICTPTDRNVVSRCFFVST